MDPVNPMVIVLLAVTLGIMFLIILYVIALQAKDNYAPYPLPKRGEAKSTHDRVHKVVPEVFIYTGRIPLSVEEMERIYNK